MPLKFKHLNDPDLANLLRSFIDVSATLDELVRALDHVDVHEPATVPQVVGRDRLVADKAAMIVAHIDGIIQQYPDAAPNFPFRQRGPSNG